MQNEIEKLELEMQSLQPLSDDAIQQRLEAGEDAESIIDQEQKNATRLRVVSLQLTNLRNKQREAAQATAKAELVELRTERDKVKDEAKKALQRMLSAVTDLEIALVQFDEQSQEAANYAAKMNRVAKLGGLPEAVRDGELTSPLFSKLQDRCESLFNGRRNTQFKEPLTIEVE